MNRITHLLDTWRESAERLTGAPDEFQSDLEHRLQLAVFKAVCEFLRHRDGDDDSDDPAVFLPNSWAGVMALDGLRSHVSYGESPCLKTE